MCVYQVYRYLPGFDWFFLDAITANNIHFASDEKYVSFLNIHIHRKIKTSLQVKGLMLNSLNSGCVMSLNASLNCGCVMSLNATLNCGCVMSLNATLNCGLSCP